MYNPYMYISRLSIHNDRICIICYTTLPAYMYNPFSLHLQYIEPSLLIHTTLSCTIPDNYDDVDPAPDDDGEDGRSCIDLDFFSTLFFSMHHLLMPQGSSSDDGVDDEVVDGVVDYDDNESVEGVMTMMRQTINII